MLNQSKHWLEDIRFYKLKNERKDTLTAWFKQVLEFRGLEYTGDIKSLKKDEIANLIVSMSVIVSSLVMGDKVENFQPVPDPSPEKKVSLIVPALEDPDRAKAVNEAITERDLLDYQCFLALQDLLKSVLIRKKDPEDEDAVIATISLSLLKDAESLVAQRNEANNQFIGLLAS